MPLQLHDADDYAVAQRRLLPRGLIWLTEKTSALFALFLGFGDEWTRLDQRFLDLIEESDPRTTTELLPDWERFAGLPDPCAPAPVTLAERREALSAKLVATGGQDALYFIEVAANLGVVITITEQQHGLPFRCGSSRCGDPMNGESSVFHWLVDGPAATPADTRARLICQFDRIEPAHLVRTHTWTA